MKDKNKTSVKDILLDKLVKRFSRNKYFSNRFFIYNREKLLSDIYNYPSFINNGYLHIERVISLAKKSGKMNGKIIVDVGAAGGIISKIFSDNFPSSKVYSFEPIKKTYNELQRYTKDNSNIIIFNKALGSSASKSEIHVLDRITSSSILHVSEKIEDAFFADSLKGKNTEEIIVSTLDIEIPQSERIGIIKMDVQGYELEVLKGGRNTLKRTDIIILEMQNHQYYKNAPQYFELDDFLRSNDFVFYDQIPSIRINDKLEEWDSVYLSKSFINEMVKPGFAE